MIYNLKLDLFIVITLVYSAELFTGFSYANFTVSCRDALDRLRVHLDIILFSSIFCFSFLILGFYYGHNIVCFLIFFIIFYTSAFVPFISFQFHSSSSFILCARLISWQLTRSLTGSQWGGGMSASCCGGPSEVSYDRAL